MKQYSFIIESLDRHHEDVINDVITVGLSGEKLDKKTRIIEKYISMNDGSFEKV